MKKELECTIIKNKRRVVSHTKDIRLFLGDITKTVTLSSGQKISFTYDATDPKKELERWFELVRTAESNRLKKYGSNKFPPDTWKHIDTIRILTEYDRECPDDINLQCDFEAKVFYDKEKKELHYVLVYSYPDSWDSFFYCTLEGEISSGEFNNIAKLITKRKYFPKLKYFLRLKYHPKQRCLPKREAPPCSKVCSQNDPASKPMPSLKKQFHQNYAPLDYAVDFVFCVDCVNIDEKQLNKISEDVLRFYEDYIKKFESTGRVAKVQRAKLIIFTSYKFKEIPVLISDFLTMPNGIKNLEKLLQTAVNYLRTDNKNESCGFEALAYALASKWNYDMKTHRHIIVLWSPNKFSADGSNIKDKNYPNGMPQNSEKLLEWWGRDTKRRLLLFVSDDSWKHIYENWSNTLIFPCDTGYSGCEEKDDLLRLLIMA